MKRCHLLPVTSLAFICFVITLSGIFAEKTSKKQLEFLTYPIESNPGPRSFFLESTGRKLAAISVVRKALTLAALKSASIKIGNNGKKSTKGRISNKNRNKNLNPAPSYPNNTYNDSSSVHSIPDSNMRQELLVYASPMEQNSYEPESNLLPIRNDQDANRPDEERRQDSGFSGSRFRTGADAENSRDNESRKWRRKKSRNRSRHSDQFDDAMKAARAIKKELDRQASIQDQLRKQIALQQKYIDVKENYFGVNNAVVEHYGVAASA